MKRWQLESAYAAEQRKNAELRRENAELKARVALLEAKLSETLETVATLKGEVASLKEQLEAAQRAGKRQANPFRRDEAELAKEPRRPGRKPGEGRWEHQRQPTDEEKAAALIKASDIEVCPCCGEVLEDIQTHEHFEWDIPPVEPVLTRFVSHSGYCPNCQKRYPSRHPDQTSQAQGAANVTLGPRATALASDMKHHLGASYGKIQDFFSVVFGLAVSRSGLWGADMRLAARASPVYAELIELVRQVWQVHVDETGWRIGTVSAWLWVFCGKDVTVYTIQRSRGHEVVLEILGQQFRGYLSADGLLTYDAAALADWLKQKCLAHILRRAKALSASKQAAHLALASGLTAVLREALELHRLRDELDGRSYAEAAAAIEGRLDALIAEHKTDADDDGARLARHLAKHRAALLPFLYEDGLEPTNNAAERALRPGVITRKVGGCNRTPEGARAHAVLATIGATCRQRGIPVLDFLIRLQRSAQAAPSIAAATPAKP